MVNPMDQECAYTNMPMAGNALWKEKSFSERLQKHH